MTLWLDLTHTAHTRARTGVQRVARALWRELGARALPICRDPFQQAWRPLDRTEVAGLASDGPARGRGSRWSVAARLRGIVRRRRPAAMKEAAAATAAEGSRPSLLCPEIFSPRTAAALPSLFASVAGPKAALFYDATPLKHPELAPKGAVARYPAYMIDLLAFDGVAAISEDARASLEDYWRWLGVSRVPTLAAIPLGIGRPAPAAAAPPAAKEGPPTILSVGTIEGRKNHAALLEACESLWSRGFRFRLRLVGMARPETARDALDRIRQLQAAGRPLVHDRAAADAALEAAYAACAFTVYPSLMEGFGLPVAESLARGKPCICSAKGALGEISRGGGCLALDAVDAPALAEAIARLLAEPRTLDRLIGESRARTFRSEADYARDIEAWVASLPAATSTSGRGPAGTPPGFS